MGGRSLAVAQGAPFKPVPLLTHSGHLSLETREPLVLVSTSVPTHGRCDEHDCRFEASELQASLGYTGKPCLKASLQNGPV